MANEGSLNCHQQIMSKLFYDEVIYVKNRIKVHEIRKEICVHTGDDDDQYESAN